MATLSKYHSDLAVRGGFYGHMQLKVVKMVFAAGCAVTNDVQANPEDPITEGTARKVAQELGAMMWEVNGSGTTMVAIMDGHPIDADIIATRVGPVAVGETGEVSAGVFTPDVTAADTVTVTIENTFLGHV